MESSKKLIKKATEVFSEEKREAAGILAGFDHKSIEKFGILLNDRGFLIEAAGKTQKPRLCKNYFYQYIHKYLKSDRAFNYQFLEAVYKAFGKADASYVAEMCGFEELLNQMIADLDRAKLAASPSGQIMGDIDYGIKKLAKKHAAKTKKSKVNKATAGV